MPATSKNQQIAAAIALHHPEKVFKRNRAMLGMSNESLSHFAETKRKGLPKKKKPATGLLSHKS